MSRDNPATDAPLNAIGLDASLTVNDLDASLRWYRDVLGFAVAREFRRDERLFAVSLRAGSARILITQETGAKGADRVKGEGFSLRLTTEQDIDALAAAIKTRGGTLESEPAAAWGMRFFRLQDPDGFRFTFSSPGA